MVWRIMRKNTAWITIIYIIIFVLLTGCAINNDGTSGSSSTSIIDTDNDTTASLTLSEEDRSSEQYKEENNRNARERETRYKYYFGNSEAYDMTEITSKEGNTVKIFVHPEWAFEQSKRDYQDAYDAIRERFGLWPINKMNMDQYVTYGWQCSVDDPELYIKCNDVSKLLGIYQNSYHYQ